MNPPPFGQVGLHHTQAPVPQRGFEDRQVADVLASRQGHGRAGAHGLPVGGGGIRGEGFFHPGELKALELRQQGHGLFPMPGLVGIGGQPAIARRFTRFVQGAKVQRVIEADLDLEGAVAVPCGTRHGEPGAGGVDAAGVGAHAGGIGAGPAIQRGAQHPMQGLAAPARVQVPKRGVQTRGALVQRAELGRLQPQDAGARRDLGVPCGRMRPLQPREQRRKNLPQQAAPVQRTAVREVAPDLAPSLRAVGVLHADPQRPAGAHGAERRHHGLLQRHSVQVRGEGLQPRPAHTLSSIWKRMYSAR